MWRCQRHCQQAQRQEKDRQRGRLARRQAGRKTYERIGKLARRQAGRKEGRRADRQAGTQAGRKADGQVGRLAHMQAVRKVDGLIGRLGRRQARRHAGGRLTSRWAGWHAGRHGREADEQISRLAPRHPSQAR